jgi:hypothetical protein
MKDYSSRNTLEGNLIKIENLYKSIFTEVGSTSIELDNKIVSINHEDSSNVDAASLEISEIDGGYTISYWDGYSLAEKIDEKELHQALKIFKRLAKKLAKNLQRFK